MIPQDNYNPIELWIWRNKRYFKNKLNNTRYGQGYGSKYTRWTYDINCQEFICNVWKQIDKCKWSKTSKELRVPKRVFADSEFDVAEKNYREELA